MTHSRPMPGRYSAISPTVSRRDFLWHSAIAMAAGFLGPIACVTAGVRLDVPYVPTPQEVVDRMLQIASVGPDDYLMDLGCGDGRIVVTAARDFGARGFGIDIDPERIREATENASRAGVTDRVEFRVGDLFETDIGKADVLAIYLLREINLRLRPKILEAMKPGARVVSHQFDMDEWRPDARDSVDGRAIYFWVVPARVNGRWQVQQGERSFELTIVQSFQDFRGNASIDRRSYAIQDGRLEGAAIAFVLEEPGNRQSFYGRVEGDRIEGVDGSTRPWSAMRLPA